MFSFDEEGIAVTCSSVADQSVVARGDFTFGGDMRVLLEPYAMDWIMQVIIFCFSPSSSFAALAVFTSGASIVISEACVFLNATWMKFEHLMLQAFLRQHMH